MYDPVCESCGASLTYEYDYPRDTCLHCTKDDVYDPHDRHSDAGRTCDAYPVVKERHQGASSSQNPEVAIVKMTKSHMLQATALLRYEIAIRPNAFDKNRLDVESMFVNCCDQVLYQDEQDHPTSS